MSMSLKRRSGAIAAMLTAAALLLLLASCSSKQAELTVSAAASLTDALQEIQTAYEAANPRIKINFNFGASGALQQQIEQGAPVDLFLSAAVRNMSALVDKGYVEADKQQRFLTNELVVVVPADGDVSVESVNDLTGDGIVRIAIGIPETVPAGSYAREALTNSGLWERLTPKMVQAKDVRQVLQYVETGNVEAGFVYKTDALTSDRVGIAFSVDTASYTPVEYPIGIVKAAKREKEATALYHYLQSAEALAVFEKYGFSVPTD